MSGSDPSAPSGAATVVAAAPPYEPGPVAVPTAPTPADLPTDSTERPPDARVGGQFARALAWTGAVKWGVQIISWPITILTAKLLSPTDYGYIAVVTVFTRMLQMVTEGGIGAAIVTGPPLDRRRLRQLNTVVLGVAVAAVCTGWLLAWPVARFYRSSTTGYVLAAFSTTVIFDGLMTVPGAILRRQFRFKDLALAEGARNLVDQGTTLTLAFLGFGFWSLVVGYSAGMVVQTVLLLLCMRVGLARPVRGEIAEPLRTGRYLVARGISDNLSLGSDRLIGGRLMTESAMGWYSYAGALAWTPADKLSSIIMRVAPSLFGTLRGDAPRLRAAMVRLTGAITLVTMPMFVGIALVADDLVAALLGPKWAGMAPVLRVFSLYACQTELFTTVGHVVQASGDSKPIAQNGFIGLFARPAAFLAGALALRPLGHPEVGLALAGAVVSTMLSLRLLAVLRERLGLTFRAYFAGVAPALVSCGVMSIAVLLARAPVARITGVPVLRLLALSAVGAVTYAAVTGLIFGPRVRELWALVQQARTRPA